MYLNETIKKACGIINMHAFYFFFVNEMREKNGRGKNF